MTVWKATASIAGAATLWGLSSTAAKALLNLQLDPVFVVQCRATFSFLVLLGMRYALRRQRLRVPWRHLWKFALLGLIGIAATNFTYYYTIRESTVATAIIIQYTSPLLVIGYAVVTNEEQVTVAKVLAAIATLGGCYLAVGAYDASVLTLSGIGVITGIGSILGFAFLTVYSRHLRRQYDVWTMLFYALAFATLFWLIVHPPQTIAARPPLLSEWIALGLLAVFSLLLPYLMFFFALRAIAPSRAIIISALEPIVAIASAAALLGESLHGLQIVGAVIVIGAIIVLQFHPEAQSHA